MILNSIYLSTNFENVYENNELKTYIQMENSISKQEIIDKINKLTISKVDNLIYLAFLDLMLPDSMINNQVNNKSKQTELVNLVFEKYDKKDSLNFIFTQLASAEIFFHKQQIYYAMTYFLLHGNNQNNKLIKDRLGLILLYLNGIITDVNTAKINNPDESPIGLLWNLGMFSSSLNLHVGSEIARNYIIFYETEKGKKFIEEWNSITGVELLTCWKILFGIFTFLKNASETKKVEYSTFSNEKFGGLVSDKDLDTFFEILSADIKELETFYRKSLTNFPNETINFEFLNEKPILKFKDDTNTKDFYSCLSFPFLVRKIVTQSVQMLREVAYKKGQKNKTDMGDGYEDYVKTILNFYNNDINVERAISTKYKGIEVSDCVIDYGDSLIFIEIKALTLMKKHIYSSKKNDIEEGLKNFLTEKGAKQLNSRIKEFHDGKIKITQIDPNNVKNYYPILITCITEIPRFMGISNYYNQILKDNNLLQESYIKPLTIINLQELESILELVKSGQSFIDILEDKHKRFPDISFQNYLLKEKNYQYKMPKLLEDKLKEISEIWSKN